MSIWFIKREGWGGVGWGWYSDIRSEVGWSGNGRRQAHLSLNFVLASHHLWRLYRQQAQTLSVDLHIWGGHLIVSHYSEVTSGLSRSFGWSQNLMGSSSKGYTECLVATVSVGLFSSDICFQNEALSRRKVRYRICCLISKRQQLQLSLRIDINLSYFCEVGLQVWKINSLQTGKYQFCANANPCTHLFIFLVNSF